MNKDIEYLYNILSKEPKKFKNKFDYKENLKKELHLQYDRFLPLTNQNNDYNYINDKFNYTFNYQRYDSSLSYKEFIKNFYNLSNVHSKVIFTNCGMSSIFGVLSSFAISGKYKLIYDKDIYFETQKIISHFKNFKHSYTKIYYLDTISDSFSFDYTFKNSIIIIDTTCYSSICFKQLIENLLDNNCFCILVRSHTKLDMLGLEYSTLGSIVFLIPNNIKNKKFEKYKKIMQNCINILSNLGMFAQENNIFPLLNDKKIIELNKDRIERIKHNNEYFLKSMKNEFELHKHKLFLTTKKIKNYDVDVLKSKLINFAKNNYEICKFSCSFGFDYIAIDTYIDLIDNKNVIRISIGDVEKEDIDIFVSKISKLLKEL